MAVWLGDGEMALECGGRTPLSPSIHLSPWSVRIAERFLASAVLRSGRALREVIGEV
jgi:hypothetical protein